MCRRYSASRIVVFSTGNVYGLTPVGAGGSRESDPPRPVGEYAMSCLGRERIFEHFSGTQGTQTAIAPVELRRGNAIRRARRPCAGVCAASETIDVTMGYFNAIWQADANAMALAALEPYGVAAARDQCRRARRAERARHVCATGRPARPRACVFGAGGPRRAPEQRRARRSMFGRPRVGAAK